MPGIKCRKMRANFSTKTPIITGTKYHPKQENPEDKKRDFSVLPGFHFV